MERTPQDQSGPETPNAIFPSWVPTEKLFCFDDAEAQTQLDEFREEYELTHGPTDTSVQYSSQLPNTLQQWLYQHHAQVYVDALPGFVRAFLQRQAEHAAACGNLDRFPEPLLALYVRNGGRISAGRQRSG